MRDIPIRIDERYLVSQSPEARELVFKDGSVGKSLPLQIPVGGICISEINFATAVLDRHHSILGVIRIDGDSSTGIRYKPQPAQGVVFIDDRPATIVLCPNDSLVGVIGELERVSLRCSDVK